MRSLLNALSAVAIIVYWKVKQTACTNGLARIFWPLQLISTMAYA